MSNIIVFKELMQHPMILEGSGNTDELFEAIGEENAERLINLGVIKTSDGTFSLTDCGKKFIELFNG